MPSPIFFYAYASTGVFLVFMKTRSSYPCHLQLAFSFSIWRISFHVHTQRYTSFASPDSPGWMCCNSCSPSSVEWHSSCWQVFPTTNDASVNILMHITVALLEYSPSNILRSGISKMQVGATLCRDSQLPSPELCTEVFPAPWDTPQSLPFLSTHSKSSSFFFYFQADASPRVESTVLT